MNRTELLAELEERLGSPEAASEALAAVLDVIIREVARGGTVAITGFGTFEQAARAARTGRNPRTGAAVRIKKTVVPKFRAGSAFKDVVKNPRSLPKTAAAGARVAAGASTKTADSARVSPAKKAATAKKTTASKATSAKKTTAKTAVQAESTRTSERSSRRSKSSTRSEGAYRAAPPGPPVLPPRPPRPGK